MVKNPFYQQNKGHLPTDPPELSRDSCKRNLAQNRSVFRKYPQGVVLHHAQIFTVFYRVSILSYAKVFAIIELFKDSCFSVSITNSKEKENNIMLTYDEFKEAMDKGFIKGDTVQIVRKNGKIHDYVLDGERVEPHETLSLEKVSDIIKELGEGK